MKNSLSNTMMLAAISLTVACGGMSRKEATAGFAATQTALTTGRMQTSGALTPDGSAVNTGFNCLVGGLAAITGSYTGNTVGAVTEYAYDLTYVFDGCNNGDVTLDGQLNNKGAAAMDDTTVDMSMDFVGTLSFSGEVEGDCEFDLHMAFSNAGTLPTATFTGTVCGYDVAKLD